MKLSQGEQSRWTKIQGSDRQTEQADISTKTTKLKRVSGACGAAQVRGT